MERLLLVYSCPIHPSWVVLSSPAGGSSQIATGTGIGTFQTVVPQLALRAWVDYHQSMFKNRYFLLYKSWTSNFLGCFKLERLLLVSHTCPIHPTWVKLSSTVGGSSQIATGTGNECKAFVSSIGSKRLTGARGVDDVGKQTRSDPMETARPGKSRSDSAESQFATDVEMRRNKRATSNIRRF